MAIISTFVAKIMFYSLFLLTNTQNFEYCTKNTDCELGFTCSKHIFYENNICKTNNYFYLQKLTPLLIEGYGNLLKMQPETVSMLKSIAKRESNNMFWSNHWSKSDIRASKASYKRLNMKNSQYPKEFYQTYGLFGQNSSIFMQHLDKNLPPQALMHPFYAMLSYKIAADKVVKKLNKGVLCNGHKYHGKFHNKPTLSDVHNAVNGGKICPRPKTHNGERWLSKNIPFVYTTVYVSDNN